MTFLSSVAYRTLARQTSPTVAAQIDAGLSAASTGDVAVGSATLTPTAAQTTNQTAAFGKLTVINATTGALTVTAPNPAGNAGKVWGAKLIATASSHTMTLVAHGSETFDGGAAPSTSTAGAMFQYTSDGTNWILTAKI